MSFTIGNIVAIIADAAGNLAEFVDDGGISRLRTSPKIEAGTNEIGKVAQGTKAAAADAWPGVLYDASGNVVGVVLDGSVYRIQGENLLVGKTAGAGSNKEVSVIDDTTDANVKRLQTETALKPGSQISVIEGAAVATDAVIDFLENGGSEDMVVDGSTTPVEFSFTADPSDDITVNEIRIVFVADTINWGAFGKGGGVLTNGIELQVQLDGAASPTTLFEIFRNEDFMRMNNPYTEFNGSDDLISASLAFGGIEKLTAGSSDFIKVIIKDNLTSALRNLSYLTATFYGTKET